VVKLSPGLSWPGDGLLPSLPAILGDRELCDLFEHSESLLRRELGYHFICSMLIKMYIRFGRVLKWSTSLQQRFEMTARIKK
jgi:hypothetical protein